MRTSVTGRLDADLGYYRRVSEAKSSGGTLPGVSQESLDQEAKRAGVLLPVLEEYAAQKTTLDRAKYFTLPTRKSVPKEYVNFLAILNAAMAFEANDFRSSVAFGKKVVVPAPAGISTADAQYQVNLYRELFFLMAAANYRLGNDADAVSWLERLKSDQTLAEMAARGSPASRSQALRAERLEALRAKPLAILPFESGARAADQWMRDGLPEVLTAELLKSSDLQIVERTQLDRVLTEAKLSQLGVTDEKASAALGKQLSAGAVLYGSVKPEPGKRCGLRISLKLGDSETATILAASVRVTTRELLTADLRAAALDILDDVGFIDPATVNAMKSARAPSANTVRALTQARLLLGTKSEEAKALYAQAMKEDPAYAQLYKDLQGKFSDISATVAVMPFANISGSGEDKWMIKGVSEALSSDLPKMHFNVVEREHLQQVLSQMALDQAVDARKAVNVGQMLGADFTVVGSILHQAPKIRIDARFVEVKSGEILMTATVEDHSDDLMRALVALSTEIAQQVNQKLSSETIEQLAAKKMTKSEFEARARKDLAQDALLRNVKPAETRSQLPFWLGFAGTVVGVAAGTTGFLVASRYDSTATGFQALSLVAPQQRDSLIASRDAYANTANTWNIVGAVGLGLAAVGIGTITIDALTNHPGPAASDAASAEVSHAAR